MPAGASDETGIGALIELMARLPGLGPRSARRAVLVLLKKRAQLMAPLAQSLAEICIVEDVADLWAMERGQIFRGRYHVLGGTLSALDAIGPDELGIPRLIARVADESIREVILALNATVDGQTTAHYIADALAGTDAQITTLAQGVPIGGELDYLDDGTIGAALRARRKL